MKYNLIHLDLDYYLFLDYLLFRFYNFELILIAIIAETAIILNKYLLIYGIIHGLTTHPRHRVSQYLVKTERHSPPPFFLSRLSQNCTALFLLSERNLDYEQLINNRTSISSTNFTSNVCFH